jgi:hypothetical protein
VQHFSEQLLGIGGLDGGFAALDGAAAGDAGGSGGRRWTGGGELEKTTRTRVLCEKCRDLFANNRIAINNRDPN